MSLILEKDFFTRERTRLLAKYPELARAEQLGKYCYIPLDIPRIEDPNLSKWFFEKCIPIIKVNPDIAGPYTGGTLFDAVDVFPKGDNFDYDKVWTINVQNEFLHLFPDLYKQISEYLPFKEIWRIRLFSSTKMVPIHRDHSKFIDFPGAFRIMLHDTNPSPTLNLIDSPFSKPTKNFIIPKLPDTNSFAWNNLRTKHGSLFNGKYRKILAVLDYGEIDVDKYIDLMERSISKYEEYTMISNNTISDYVNT